MFENNKKAHLTWLYLKAYFHGVKTYLESIWGSGKALNQTSASHVLGLELDQSRASVSLIPVGLYIRILVKREKKRREQTKDVLPLFLVLPQFYCFRTKYNSNILQQCQLVLNSIYSIYNKFKKKKLHAFYLFFYIYIKWMHLLPPYDSWR